MTAAIFRGAALYLWTRSRLTFAFMAGAYLLLFAAAGTTYAEPGNIAFIFAMGFLWFTPFLVPVQIFTGSGTASTTDLLTTDSMFPRHFFNLPVRASRLVLPFMVYCALFAALQWALANLIGRYYTMASDGFWLPVMATSFVLWAQTIMWTSVRSKLARVAQFSGVLVAYIAVFFGVLSGSVSTNAVIALSLAQLPIAYVVAARAVSQTRQGEHNLIVRKRELPAKPSAITVRSRMPELPRPFSAQTWMERDVHRSLGKSLLFVIVPLVAVLWGPLFLLSGRQGEALPFLGQAGITAMLVVLVVISISTGVGFATFRKNIRWQHADAYTMPAYFAALPFATGDFAWAKVKAAATNTLWVSAGILLICGALAYTSGYGERWLAQHETWRRDYGLIGTLAIGVLPALLFTLLAISSTVNVLWVGLYSSRRSAPRMLVASLAIGYAGIVGTAPVFLGTPRNFIVNIQGESLWLLVALKIAALALLIYHVRSKRLLGDVRLAMLVGLWGVTTTAFVVYCAWHVPAARLSFTDALGLGLLLSPVLGGVAAPLFLSLNRAQ